MSEFAIRAGVLSDRPFVFSSWLRSFRLAVPDYLPAPVYFDGQHQVVERLLDRGQLVVAHAAGDVDQILGWACCERSSGPLLLHYVYVKEPFRRFRIATALLDQLGARDGFFTHRTQLGAGIAQKRHLTFNPYAAGVPA